jgi:hypothetical protein
MFLIDKYESLKLKTLSEILQEKILILENLFIQHRFSK